MMKVEGKLHYHNTWIILKMNNDIAKYYQWLIFKETLLKAQTPKEGAHVTVLAGKYEEPKIPDWRKKWGMYEGLLVTFEYQPYLHFDGTYFWLTGESKMLSAVRKDLGLAPTPYHPFHLTVGNLKQ